MRDVKERYFNWMRELVCANEPYYNLCNVLHNIDFIPIIDLDENRCGDGVDLRYRFGYEHRLHSAEIASELDDRPCSVFEMMVALAIRCEESIMSDSFYGDRTHIWFHEMISSLGLDNMDDDNFDEGIVRKNIQVLIDRDYSRDGRGGLFTIPNCRYDLREVEIWYQAMWYLAEVSEDE